MEGHDRKRKMASRRRSCRNVAMDGRNRGNARRCGRQATLCLWLSVVVALLLNVAQVVEATSTDFVMDGATTYCWEVDTSIYSNTVDSSSVNMVTSEGDGCPLQLSIDFPTTDVYAYDTVDISWNATLRWDSNDSFLTNDFGVDALYAGLDRISQTYYEVTASRLRTCVYGADCNPVTTGSQLTENTTNIPSNFSTAGLAEFDSTELAFDGAGNYTLLAHLILPSSTPTSKRYDYAVFLKVQILSHSSDSTENTTSEPYSESTSDSASTGVSTEVVCVLVISGIVVVALVAIGFTTLRAKVDRPAEATAANNGSKNNNPKNRQFGFSSNTSVNGAVAVVGSDEDGEEFAMLSVHESSMRRGNTFLSALSRGPLKKKKSGSPIPFAGPMVRQSFKRKGPHGDDDSMGSGDITPQGIIMDTPATGRGNYAIEDTPKPMPKPMAAKPKQTPRREPAAAAAPRRIMFNDIMEDEVDTSSDSRVDVGRTNFEHSATSTVVDLNLTDVSVRIKQHHATAQEEESWRARQVKQNRLTADDLRPSENKGPLELSDLHSSHVRHRGESDF